MKIKLILLITIINMILSSKIQENISKILKGDKKVKKINKNLENPKIKNRNIFEIKNPEKKLSESFLDGNIYKKHFFKINTECILDYLKIILIRIHILFNYLWNFDFKGIKKEIEIIFKVLKNLKKCW